MLLHGLQFLLKGGWVMWPLFGCAIVSLTVMIERLVTMRHATADLELLMREVRRHLKQGKPGDAAQLCQRTPGPVAAILAQGLAHWRDADREGIEDYMEEMALRQIPLLQKRLGILDSIITLSPLLGLLGTITGMIRSFQVIAIASGSEAGFAITGGVAEALIATATGLTIAIVTLPVYNHLNERVRDLTSDMEVYATELLTLVDRQHPSTVKEEMHASAAS